MATMVEAVIFDLDDTLIVEQDVARAALAGALEFVGAPPDVDQALEAIRGVWRTSVHHPRCLELGVASWEALWATFENCHPSITGLRDWVPEYRLLAWEAALGSLGSDPGLATTSADRYIHAQRQGHPVSSGAAAALQSVGHLPRAVLTNGPPDIEELKLLQTGLADEFQVVAVSGTLGVGKPDPMAFTYVLDQLGVSPERAVMVGDSWSRDIQAAHAVGMHAIWVSHGRAAPPELPGVRTINELDEFATLDL